MSDINVMDRRLKFLALGSIIAIVLVFGLLRAVLHPTVSEPVEIPSPLPTPNIVHTASNPSETVPASTSVTIPTTVKTLEPYNGENWKDTPTGLQNEINSMANNEDCDGLYVLADKYSTNSYIQSYIFDSMDEIGCEY